MLAYNQGARPSEGNVALSVRVYRGRRAGDIDAYLKAQYRPKLVDAEEGKAGEGAGGDEMRTYVLSKEQRAAAYDVSNPLGDDFPAHVAACAVAYSSNN